MTDDATTDDATTDDAATAPPPTSAIRTNQQTLRGRWRAITRMATACLRADRKRTIASILLDIASGAAGPFLAVGTGMLIDAIANHRGRGAVVLAVAVLGGSAGALLSLSLVADRVRIRLEENVAHHIELEVMDMVTGLTGIAHHENPDHLYRIDRLLEEAWLVAMAVPALVATVEIVVRFSLTVGLLAHIDGRLALLPLSCVPTLWAGVIAERIRLVATEARSEIQRHADFLFWLVGRPEHSGELRAAGAGTVLIDRYRADWAVVADDEYRHRMRGGWRLAIGRAIFAAGFGLGLLVIAQRASTGAITVGALVTAIGLSGQVIGQATSVNNRLNWLNWALQGVRHYVWLLAYHEAHAEPPAPVAAPTNLVDGIVFDNVTFAYPDTDAVVLDHIDLRLPAGSVVAIVGDNGAGKTTIIKLLLRFYEPTSGRILVDGVPLGEIDVADWRRHGTAALQDHTRPELILREAIGIGDTAILDDEDAVGRAAQLSGADAVVADLPKGLATQLGVEWPGGTDLSGGQWQRLAVARSAMRPEPVLLVLDEPTAALDPTAEHALFQQYAGPDDARRERGAVTVIISHRLSTVRMADAIVVLDGGRIVETGTHDELVDGGGRYAELFAMQAAGYR
jgi:ATP-binding cassette subfamily B protein